MKRKFVSNRTLEFVSQGGEVTPDNPQGLEVITIEPGDTVIIESPEDEVVEDVVEETTEPDMVVYTEEDPAEVAPVAPAISSEKPAAKPVAPAISSEKPVVERKVKDFRSSVAIKGSILRK